MIQEHTVKQARKTPAAFVGTSGFIYDHWGGDVFYPEGLPQRKWLEYYVEYFDTVEINVAFYRLPSEEAFKSWYERTPKGFTFALKGSRFITHVKKLKDCKEPSQLYFSRACLLKEKLSVVLWQLPPRYKKNVERLKDFIQLLRPYSAYRHAFEFRDTSWIDEEIYNLLGEANMAVCEADWPGMPQNLAITADFAYLRRHGTQGELGPYAGRYNKAFLRKDSKRVKDLLAQGKRAYIYFNNDAEGWAVKNALELKEMLKNNSYTP